jgi:hypothetical protein
MYNSNRIIEEYQQNVAQKLTGLLVESALKEFGVAPTVERITYILVLLKLSASKKSDGEPTNYLQIPVQYLFSSVTPFDVEDYGKSVFKNYISRFTKNTIQPLQHLVSVTNYGESYCRRFKIGEELIEKIKEKDKSMSYSKLPPVEMLKFNPSVGTKPAKWGGRELTVTQLPVTTKSAWQKLKKSRFVFDFDLFFSDTGRAFNQSLDMNDDQRAALRGSLDHIQNTSKPQYHDSFYIQRPGRLHTRGGPMSLNSQIRRFYVKPTKPDSVCLEVDLKCAQLLVLCEILQADQVKDTILQIIKNESIWNYIEPSRLHKVIKKVIVYGFCFGAKMYELPYLATTKAKNKYNIQCSVSSSEVEKAFSGILNPLVDLRHKWLNQYSISRIESGDVKDLLHTNDLGLEFNLKEAVLNYKAEARGRVDDLKVAGQLLAHYCQGKEQLIIQSLLANSVEENIITYSYDGFTLEVKSDKLQSVKSRLVNWMEVNHSDYILESEEYS